MNSLEDIVDRVIALLLLIKLALFASVASYALQAPVQGPDAQERPAPERLEPVPVNDALADLDILAVDEL